MYIILKELIILHLCKLPDGECRLRLGRRRQLPHELSQLRVQDALLKYLGKIIKSFHKISKQSLEGSKISLTT